VNNPIDMTGVPLQQAAAAATGDAPPPRFDPQTGEPLFPEPVQPPIGYKTPQQDPGDPAHTVNPYAPTGWKRRYRVEFDITVPSGQLCRVMRLEREDLFRMDLIQYLDTFTPMLMQESVSDLAARRQIENSVKDDPTSLSKMFVAIDQVVLAATIRPRVTDDENKVDYGQSSDWSNPKFIATAFISDLEMEDRMAIFGAAFGRSMDDLKSVFQEESSLGSVANEPGVQQAAQ
jgi:hypothetical protein